MIPLGGGVEGCVTVGELVPGALVITKRSVIWVVAVRRDESHAYLTYFNRYIGFMYDIKLRKSDIFSKDRMKV